MEKLTRNAEGVLCVVLESQLAGEFEKELSPEQENQVRQVFEEKKREAESLSNRKDDVSSELAELEVSYEEVMKEVTIMEKVFPVEVEELQPEEPNQVMQ